MWCVSSWAEVLFCQWKGNRWRFFWNCLKSLKTEIGSFALLAVTTVLAGVSIKWSKYSGVWCAIFSTSVHLTRTQCSCDFYMHRPCNKCKVNKWSRQYKIGIENVSYSTLYVLRRWHISGSKKLDLLSLNREVLCSSGLRFEKFSSCSEGRGTLNTNRAWNVEQLINSWGMWLLLHTSSYATVFLNECQIGKYVGATKIVVELKFFESHSLILEGEEGTIAHSMLSWI